MVGGDTLGEPDLTKLLKLTVAHENSSTYLDTKVPECAHA